MAWVTDETRKLQPLPVAPWKSYESGSSNALTLELGGPRQRVLGFGAAFTDATCIVIQRMPQAARTALLEDLFSPSGLGLSMGRTCIGASDYSASLYSFDESSTPDPELKLFDLSHDRQNILPVLRAARSIRPDLFLFSSPWSPPGWMKAGNSMLGGSMRKKYFGPYADYFVKFLKGYASEGVPIQAVTVQNEVDTDQDGRMPATLWGQEYEIEFVTSFLSPALRRASLETKIWVLDHNYNLVGRAIDELSDTALRADVDGVAWHGYVGNTSAMTEVHDRFPGTHMYWTEGGPDITAKDYSTDWARWGETFCALLNNYAECIVAWNLALDEKGQPNIGPFPCGGLVTVDSKTNQVSYSGMYRAMMHLSRFVPRGSTVLQVKMSPIAGVSSVAFKTKNGRTLVLVNRGPETKLALNDAGRMTEVTLPPNSVVTIVW
jgi:glucosylceramidase